MATAADRIFIDAVIYPGRASEPIRGALAVRDGKVQMVGPADAVLAEHAGPDTAVIDLKGAFLHAGFVDAHNHHAIAGMRALYELEISEFDGLDEIIAAVRSGAADLDPDGWLVGGGWSPALLETLATESALRNLDEAAQGRPVVLRDQSCHNRWVNSAVLNLVGTEVVAAAGDRVAEFVLRDPQSGADTGVLLEEAGLPVERALNASLPDQRARHVAASRHAIEILHGFGVTAFQDAASSLAIMTALHDLDVAGELQCWVVSSAVFNDPLFGFAPVGDELIAASRDLAGPRHRPDSVKIFLDGIPPMHTAAFLAPYLPDTAHGEDFVGQTTFTTADLTEHLLKLAEAGMSVKVHCTGDASVRATLDAVERVRAAGFTKIRFHVAHGQFVDPADIPRFEQLDVTADISPYLWFPGVIPDAIATVVPQPRAGCIHPNRDLVDAKARVCGGSDWPVTGTPNPWIGIHGLVTRRDPEGSYADPLWFEQAVSLAEALDIFSANGAEALGLAEITGSLRPGLSADFAITDLNPFEIPSRDLANVTVRQTWFAGECVYEA